MKNRFMILIGVFCLISSAWAQSSMDGTVINKVGRPLSGITVQVVGDKTVNAVTDINGKFSLPVSKGMKLSLCMPDFSSKIVTVEDENNTTIIMADEDMSVDYATGAPVQTQMEATGAVSIVRAEDLKKNSALSVRDALYGQVLGLTALQNPGQDWDTKSRFFIRGLQSLSGGSEVLVLVDGLERPIDDLTVEEVESVSVLKDAAAVALYGYRGINGVISVQTKRGIYNTMNIDFSYDHGFARPVRMPKFANAYTYASAMNEAYANDGKMPRYNQYELDAFRNGSDPYMYPDVDWMDETLGATGHSDIYNLSFRGGGKSMRYYTLLNLENSSGFFKNTETNDGYSTQSKYSKANIRANLDIDIFKGTTLQVNLLGILMEYNHAKPGTIMNSLYSVPSAAFPVKTKDGIWGGSTTWSSNPVANLQSNGYDRSHARTLMADMTLSQNLDFITKGLKASVRLGYDNNTNYWELRSGGYQYASDVYTFDGETPMEVIRTLGGKNAELSFTKSYGPLFYRFNFIGTVDYTRKFAKSDLYASLNWREYHGVADGQYNTINNEDISLYTHYGVLDKYFIDMALVLSGSSRLPQGHKYNFSPTLSVAWVLSKEKFLSNVSWLNMLKLRASAGILHSDYVPEYNMTEQQFNSSGAYWFGDNFTRNGGYTEGHLPTTNFMAQRAFKYNVGLDISCFRGLMMTIDGYYQRRDRNMVKTGGAISSILGVEAPYEALGIVDSKGIEIGLNYDRNWRDLIFSAGVQFSYAKNKIIEQMEQPRAYDYLCTTGYPMNQPFGLEAIGFFENEEDIKKSPEQKFSAVKPGDIKYKDQNGDKVIDDNDKIAIGYNMNVPEIYGSFKLGLEYKGIGIDMLFQGVTHYSTWLNTQSVYRPLVNNNTISTHYYDNRWTPDHKDARYPRLTSEQNQNNTQNSTLWLGDASYLKLRQCEVYYNFPHKLISPLKLQKAKLYVRGMDLFSLDHMDVFDPEAVGVNYPTNRSIHVGFSIGF